MPILRKPASEFVPATLAQADAEHGLDAARPTDHVAGERRNLVMQIRRGAPIRNHAHAGRAYQMILPGERAPSPGHSSRAAGHHRRKGSFSTVNGEKMPMETGDVVSPRAGAGTATGTDGSEPAYGSNGLDVPLTPCRRPCSSRSIRIGMPGWSGW